MDKEFIEISEEMDWIVKEIKRLNLLIEDRRKRYAELQKKYNGLIIKTEN